MNKRKKRLRKISEMLLEELKHPHGDRDLVGAIGAILADAGNILVRDTSPAHCAAVMMKLAEAAAARTTMPELLAAMEHIGVRIVTGSSMKLPASERPS